MRRRLTSGLYPEGTEAALPVGGHGWDGDLPINREAAPTSIRRRSKLDLIARLRACDAAVLATAPLINHGGCSVYAAVHVAQALEARGLTVWAVLTSSVEGRRSERHPLV